MTEGNGVTFNVSRIYEAKPDKWGIEFSDGVTLHCAKQADQKRIAAALADHAERGDPDHHARIVAMVDAVKDYEARL